VFFRYVLGDLEIAYKMYVPSVEELCQQNPHHNLVYKMDSVETVILFHLRALADLGKHFFYCTFCVILFIEVPHRSFNCLLLSECEKLVDGIVMYLTLLEVSGLGHSIFTTRELRL
jgi:hypothetical protein